MAALEAFVQRTSQVRAELARLRAAIAAHEQEEADGTINESQQNQELVNNILEPLAEHLGGAVDAADQAFGPNAVPNFSKHSWMLDFNRDEYLSQKRLLKCLRMSPKRRVSLMVMAYIVFPLYLGCVVGIWFGPGALLMTAFWTQFTVLLIDSIYPGNFGKDESLPALVSILWAPFHNRHERLNLTPPGPQIAPLEEDEVQGRALLQSIYAYIDAHGSKGYNLEEAKVLLECFAIQLEVVWAVKEREVREAWLFDAARLARSNGFNLQQMAAYLVVVAGVIAGAIMIIPPTIADSSTIFQFILYNLQLLTYAISKYYLRAFDLGPGLPLFVLSFHFPWLGIVGWAVVVGAAHIVAIFCLKQMSGVEIIDEEL